MKPHIGLLIASTASLCLAIEPPEHSITTETSGHKLSWTCQSGETYFLQYSTNLTDWGYFADIEHGSGTCNYYFSSPEEKFFVRIIAANYPIPAGLTAETADFDNDGISNIDEIRAGGTGTDPLQWDTDGDGQSDYIQDQNLNGVADGWEIKHYGGLGIVNPQDDNDGDGLNNLAESQINTDPIAHASTADSDDDGVLDVNDAAPGEDLINWQRSPETPYALVLLPDAPSGGSFASSGSGISMSEDGYVLARVTDDYDTTGESDSYVIAKLGDTAWSAPLPRTLGTHGDMYEYKYSTIGSGGLALGTTVVYQEYTIGNGGGTGGNFQWMPIKRSIGDVNATAYLVEDSALKVPSIIGGVHNPPNFDEHENVSQYECSAPILAPDDIPLYQKHSGIFDSARIVDPTKITLGGNEIGFEFVNTERLIDFPESLPNETFYREFSLPGAGGLLAATEKTTIDGKDKTTLHFFEGAQSEAVHTQSKIYFPYDVAKMPDQTGNQGTGRPAIIGWAELGTQSLWIKGNSGWKHPKIFDVKGTYINTRGEIITTSGKLWRNGIAHDLESLCEELEGYEEVLPIGLKDNGQIFVALKTTNANSYRLAVLLPMAIVPDFDRDGKINQHDRGQITKTNPFRWWINDDDDQSSEERGKNEYDIPKQTFINIETGLSIKDCSDLSIDGMRDLIDFFPLHLDLKTALMVFPRTEYDYLLSHDDGALKFYEYPACVIEGTDTTRAPNRHVKLVGVGRALATKDLMLASSSGTPLSPNMLDMAEQGKGVLVLEGAEKTNKPLLLKITKKSGGSLVAKLEFPMNIVDVEDMYRHVNMRALTDGSGGAASQKDEPPEYPDYLTNGRYVAYVHGYNISGESARGSQSNIFKRFHQLGSKARYIGISWFGNPPNPGVDLLLPPDYHKAVNNGLISGFLLKGQLALPENAKLTVLAHSLGNVVASHAIANHGLKVDHYYIINGAIALQAYDQFQTGNSSNDLDMKRNMTEDLWKPYYDYSGQERLFAANWHELFDPAVDNRGKLTWKNIFAKPELLSVAYNFYSPSDHVVENPDDTEQFTDIDNIHAAATDEGRHAWVQQEMAKGNRDNYIAIAGFDDLNGGWEFNIIEEETDIVYSEWERGYYKELLFPNSGLRRKFTPEEAEDEITDADLRLKPFHNPFLYLELYDPALGSGYAAVKTNRYKLLATGIPATSYAIAVNAIPKLALEKPNEEKSNFNMPVELKSPGGQSSWPAHPKANDPRDWMHGDFKDVAFQFLHPMYQKMIDLGELDEN